MLPTKTWFLLITCVLLGREGNSTDEELGVLIGQNRALHYFYIDGRIPEATLIRFLLPLLSELDISKYRSKFSILNAAGSIIIPETSTLTGWLTNYKPTGNPNLDLIVIEDSIIGLTESDTVVQGPVNFYIITNDAQFDDTATPKLKAANKNGEIFIFTPNTEDPKRHIYSMSNPKTYLYTIKNTVMKQPTRIYPNRANSTMFWGDNIDRNTVLVMEIKGVSSPKYNYTLLINGTRSAPLHLCTDTKMTECFEKSNNFFEISLNNSSMTLSLTTNISSDIDLCTDDDCPFPDSSRVIFELRVTPLESTSNSYTNYIIVGLVMVIIFIIILVAYKFLPYSWRDKYKAFKNRTCGTQDNNDQSEKAHLNSLNCRKTN